MSKRSFLAQLRQEVTRVAEAELSGTGRTTQDCPWIDYWFAYYGKRDAAYVERAIRRFVPAAVSAKSARDYIPVISERVRASVAIWVSTGKITGLPFEPVGALTDAASADRPSDLQLAFKDRTGAARERGDPQAIQTQLGVGRPLETGVRSRMESAFGTDLSLVRIHTDGNAAALSSSLNARAFTVGNNIAFGDREYSPGSAVGDALLAHELAHVMQQRGTDQTAASSSTDSSDNEPAELDADRVAVGAVVALWSGFKGLTQIRENAVPRLRSGLRLQRCRRGSAALPTVRVGNFRNTGSTADSGENNCDLCPLPLGILASSGKNRMELRGDIAGHVANAEYDFKRTKERATWELVGGAWTQTSHVGPGADDDSHDRDEDLTPENDHIYVEDGPGFRTLAGAATDPAATEAVYKASFVEWVNVRVDGGEWQKSSNEFEWHSISWLEQVGGSWQRKAGANEIETGSTTVGTGNP